VVETRVDFTGSAGYPPRLQRGGKLELTEAPRSQIAAEGIPEGFRALKPGRVALRGEEAIGGTTLIALCGGSESAVAEMPDTQSDRL